MMTADTQSMALGITLRNVYKSFGQAQIINGVSLSIAPQEFHAIIGPNGAGKSTLFNLISGRFPLTSGEILLGDTVISGKSPRDIHHLGLSRSFQITNIFQNLSVFENMRCALLGLMGAGYNLFRRASSYRAITQKTDELLADINLLSRRNELAGNLSYAEQRALEVGMTIAGDAKVLLLDEPMAGMNHNEIEQFSEFLKRIAIGRTVIMVEHDMGVVFRLADRISVLVYGELLATDTPDMIRADARVKAAYLGADA